MPSLRPAPILRRVRPCQLAPRPAPNPSCRRFQSSDSTATSSTPDSSSSVNPSEISHFNALASTWWDPYGSSRLLHLMNPLRHDFIRTCHASQPDAYTNANVNAGEKRLLRYLDVGCGGGIFAESAARLRSVGSVTGLDPSPDVLAVARAHARRDPSLQLQEGASPGDNKLRYLQGSVESLPPPETEEGMFDVVSLFEVLEHVDNPSAFLDRCGAFVRPGGWLVLSTIARTWMSWLTTNFVAEGVLGIVPKGTHDWAKYINEEELRGYFNKNGWNSPRCMGVVYVPGLGWREVRGSEKVGNYFFGVRKGG